MSLRTVWLARIAFGAVLLAVAGLFGALALAHLVPWRSVVIAVATMGVSGFFLAAPWGSPAPLDEPPRS